MMAYTTPKELSSLRAEVDIVDVKLLELLLKRFELVDKIGHVKKENKIPVFVPGREDEILENLTRKIDSKYSMYIKDTFAHLLDVSKQYQVESVR